MNEQEQKAILHICLMAAFADGRKDEQERVQIRRIIEGLAPGAATDLPGLYQDILLARRTLQEVAAELATPETRSLAYEMAVCVCDADGPPNEDEAAFLERLREVLALDAEAAQTFAGEAAEIAGADLAARGAPAPVASAGGTQAGVDTAELDKMVLNYALLNGALELLPQSLASMAILALQTKMVYRIGKAYGYELDRAHIKEFAAALGVGFAGQYVEQIGRKLIGGLLKKAGGRMLGGLGGAATGSVFSFATTYALGQAARQYYAGGRTIDGTRLRQMFATLLEQGKTLQANYSGEIQRKARGLDMRQIAALVRQQ